MKRPPTRSTRDRLRACARTWRPWHGARGAPLSWPRGRCSAAAAWRRRPRPTRHRCTCSTPGPTVATTARRDDVLAVSAPRAAPGFDSAAMAYVQKEHALDHFATHRWADTPARMLGQPLTRTLEETGSFRAVVPAPAAACRPICGSTPRSCCCGRASSPRPSRVELTLRVQLVDVPRPARAGHALRRGHAGGAIGRRPGRRRRGRTPPSRALLRKWRHSASRRRPSRVPARRLRRAWSAQRRARRCMLRCNASSVCSAPAAALVRGA